MNIDNVNNLKSITNLSEKGSLPFIVVISNQIEASRQELEEHGYTVHSVEDDASEKCNEARTLLGDKPLNNALLTTPQIVRNIEETRIMTSTGVAHILQD